MLLPSCLAEREEYSAHHHLEVTHAVQMDALWNKDDVPVHTTALSTMEVLILTHSQDCDIIYVKNQVYITTITCGHHATMNYLLDKSPLSSALTPTRRHDLNFFHSEITHSLASAIIAPILNSILHRQKFAIITNC